MCCVGEKSQWGQLHLRPVCPICQGVLTGDATSPSTAQWSPSYVHEIGWRSGQMFVNRGNLPQCGLREQQGDRSATWWGNVLENTCAHVLRPLWNTVRGEVCPAWKAPGPVSACSQRSPYFAVVKAARSWGIIHSRPWVFLRIWKCWALPSVYSFSLSVF